MKYKNLLLLLVLSLLMISCAEDDPQNGNLIFPPKVNPQVRFINLLRDSVELSLAINDTEIYSNLKIYETTGYLEVSTDKFNLKINNKSGQTIINEAIELMYGEKYTFFIAHIEGRPQARFERDKSSDVPTLSKIRFFQNFPDAGMIDIRLNDPEGSAIFNDINEKELSLYRTISGGVYSFVINEAATFNQLAALEYTEIERGSVYTIVINGTVEQDNEMTFFARFFSDMGDGSEYFDLLEKAPEAFINVLNAIPDSVSYRLYVNDSLYGEKDYEYPGATGYVGVPAGSEIRLRAESDQIGTIIDTTLSDLREFGRYSAFFSGTREKPVFIFIEDIYPEVEKGFGSWRFINLSPDAGAVNVRDKEGLKFFGEEFIAFGEQTGNFSRKAADFDVRFINEAEEEVYRSKRISIAPAKYYTLILRGRADGSETYPLRTTLIKNK